MEKRTRRKLESCPFCGSTDVTIEHDRAIDGMVGFDYYVVCNNCDAEGGCREKLADAVRAWNKRA